MYPCPIKLVLQRFLVITQPTLLLSRFIVQNIVPEYCECPRCKVKPRSKSLGQGRGWGLFVGKGGRGVGEVGGWGGKGGWGGGRTTFGTSTSCM